jgi:hypothetical protein
MTEAQAALTKPQSSAQTFSSGLKQAVIDLTMALRTDYRTQFVAAFPDEGKVTEFKNRLLTALKGRCVGKDLVDGYELLIECPENRTYMPTIPTILQYAMQCRGLRLEAEKNASEAGILARALPNPVSRCNPLEMLAQAKALVKSSGGVSSLDEKRKQHEALLADHARRGLIPKANVALSLCAVEGCQSVGHFSSGTNGKGNFYCARHFKARV